MNKKPHQANRYDVGGTENDYIDAEQRVLMNKKGITTLEELQLLEEEGLVKAYGSLTNDVRVDTPMSCELIRHVHHLIFGDLYQWAGRWRTVTISKDTTTWPPPDFLEDAMQQFEKDVLRRYPATKLNSDDEFCIGLSVIQGEFLSIHPFREGNARTIKLVTDLLALQAGRPFLKYDASDHGIEEYIDAAKAAMVKDYSKLQMIISKALERSH
jgi:cell filamentation protein